MDADVEAASGFGHPQGLDEVALGEVVVAHVERAPSGDPGEFGGAGVELLTDDVGVVAVQEWDGVLAQDAGDRGGCAGASAEFRVRALGVSSGCPQVVQVVAADAAGTGVCGVRVGRDGKPPGDRCAVGADSEGA
ncbi:hypothetical protein [Streptomyces rishiriensis]|uniref:Uncharacterized protein n=1 Tax=Streptomyces rishiriensis TaxID=68264 RepID=A0ABU0NG86_STRRH|nr:hypothetical protein [Streptomyces rishiriensis]MDQ0578114.1 hypothetical protein [Streptomyces rishiriensis]